MTLRKINPDKPLTERSAPRKSLFSVDVLKLVSGTTIAQILGILAYPILTRIYAPDAFGTLALFLAITSILGIIASMRYEMAIMLPESDEEAANLLGVSLLFIALMALMLVAIVWLSKDLLLGWLNTPSLKTSIWLVPPTIFCDGVFKSFNYWNSRTKHFGRLSIAQVTSSVSTTIAKLGLGFTGFTTAGAMISANTGGTALAMTILGGQIWRDHRALFLRCIKIDRMWQGIKRYRKFPLFDSWSTLLNSISWQLPALMLTVFFSSTVAGYYALGYRLLQMPMSLIGNAIAQVFFQRAAEAHVRGSLNIVVEDAFSRLVMIGLLPMLVVAFVGRDLFAFAFGSSWAEAGLYSQILSVWAFFWFVSSPLSTIFATLEKQGFLLKFNLLNLLFRFTSLTIGGILQDPRTAVLLFSISGVIVYCYLTLSILLNTGASLRKISGKLRVFMVLNLVLAIIMACLWIIDASFEVQLLIAGCFAAICYFILVKKWMSD